MGADLGKTHFLVAIPHPSHLVSEFSSSCLAAGKGASIWPVWSNRPDFVEDSGIAACCGAFSFFVQPARAGFAAQHAFLCGPVFGWGVGEVVDFAGFRGGEGMVAKDRGEDAFHSGTVQDDGLECEDCGWK